MGGGGDNSTLIIGGIFVLVFLIIFFVGIGTMSTAGAFLTRGGGGNDSESGGGSSFSCSGSSFTIKERGEVVDDRTPEVNKQYKTGKPDDFVPLYQAAAKKYKLGEEGPNFLAGVHQIETGYGGNLNVSTAGALGHMQFMPATWQAYGVDANGDGKRNPWDVEDAVFAAARYLRASGAPRDWDKAIFAYNHADWYVAEVKANAQNHNIEPCD